MSSLQARCICHLIEGQVIANRTCKTREEFLEAKHRWMSTVCANVIQWH